MPSCNGGEFGIFPSFHPHALDWLHLGKQLSVTVRAELKKMEKGQSYPLFPAQTPNKPRIRLRVEFQKKIKKKEMDLHS